LLLLALELTKDSKLPVGEFGAGIGSTPYLRLYCMDNERIFISYDSNKEWADKWGSEFIDKWDAENIYSDYSVVLIDQAPGEHRHTSTASLKDKATIIVIHDAEPDHGCGYRLEEIWGLFKWRIYYKDYVSNIWSAAVSNFIDLSIYNNTTIGKFKLEI
jgi:hypothetical protein